MGEKRSGKKPLGFTLPQASVPHHHASRCHSLLRSAKLLSPAVQSPLANDCDSAPLNDFPSRKLPCHDLQTTAVPYQKWRPAAFIRPLILLCIAKRLYANQGQKPYFYPVTGFIAVSSFSRRFSSPPRKTVRYRHDKHKLTG